MISDKEYEHINTALNSMIGQLTVPLVKFRDADIKAVHAKLLELAGWLDDKINDLEIEELEPKRAPAIIWVD